MSIIRVSKRANPFVQIDKSCLEDPRLSWKAKGLLAYLLSRPDDWKIVVSHLEKQSKDGRDAVYSAINELREHGYCYRSPEQMRDATGKLIGYEYTVYETSEKPYTDFPYKDYPYMEKPTLNNKDSNNKDYDYGKLNKQYSDGIFPITAFVADAIVDAVEDYGYAVVEAGIKNASAGNGSTWNYVKMCIENVRKHGPDWTPEKKSYKKSSGRNMKDGFTKGNEETWSEEQKQRDLEHARTIADRDISRRRSAA